MVSNNDFTIKWIELPFPENIEDLLVEEPVRKHENHFNEEFEMEQENLEEIRLDEDSDDEEDEWKNDNVITGRISHYVNSCFDVNAQNAYFFFLL